MQRSLGLVVLLALACSDDGGADPANLAGATSGGSLALAGASATAGTAAPGVSGAPNPSVGGAGAQGVAGSSVGVPSGGAGAFAGTSGAASTSGSGSGGAPSAGGTSSSSAGAPRGGSGAEGGLIGRGPGRGGSSAGGRSGGAGGTSGASGAANAGTAGAAGSAGGNGADCSGRITYTLARAAAPTAQQTMAYERITTAMERAVQFYNCHTDIQKSLNVSYNPDVPTADGNPNGSMRFGSMDSMNYITAMHEISHTVGIGSNEMDRLVVDGIFPGANATAQLREITGNPMDQVHADNQHFWPYGLNYTTEVKSEADLLNHCKMVVAIRKDLGF